MIEDAAHRGLPEVPLFSRAKAPVLDREYLLEVITKIAAAAGLSRGFHQINCTVSSHLFRVGSTRNLHPLHPFTASPPQKNHQVFRPERWLPGGLAGSRPTMLSFHSGPFTCLGMSLYQLEAKVGWVARAFAPCALMVLPELSAPAGLPPSPSLLPLNSTLNPQNPQPNPHPIQSLVATLVRGYDLELLCEPAYVPWLNLPVSVPDKRWPLWARLTRAPPLRPAAGVARVVEGDAAAVHQSDAAVGVDPASDADSASSKCPFGF
jgi:hypothetical protein